MSTPLEPSDDTAEFGAGKNDSGFQVKEPSQAAAEGSGQDKITDPAELGGSVLGDFHLLRILGSGGMANVYLAEQTSLKRKVALKVLRPDLLADDTNLERFAREATAAAGLNHNNIVQVFSVGEQGGLQFPGDAAPGFSDFVNFAFVIGMTCQTADVNITGAHIRRVATFHGLFAFAFNLGILALAVNALASI